MKRVDLSWAIKAVMPHVGTQPGAEAMGIKQVGVEHRDGQLYLFATDRYTAGIARVREGAAISGSLAKQEAVELEQFVRTSYKAEEDDDLAYAVRGNELHIGFARMVDRHGERADDSAVFDLAEPGRVTLDYLLGEIARVNAAPPTAWDEQIYLPDLMERFGKAEREHDDRMRVFPRHSAEHRGVAIVTVGSDFLGLVSGLTYDDAGAATLADWCIPAERIAA